MRYGEVIAQNYDIFRQFRRKLAITHTIAIKWKEKHNAVVVDCLIMSPQFAFVW